MSGHSKWATTKRAKFATDAKKAAIFTKLSKTLTVAARDKGGDPETNFSLRLAIEKAKAANMPKENIERAIKKGTGEIESAKIEEIMYEGFGPGGSAIIIKALTDNKNRTAQSIKHLLTKHGGSLGGPNSVMWQFEQKGVIRISSEELISKNSEDLELKIIDFGAQDIIKEKDAWIIYTKIEDLQNIKKNIEDLDIETEYADLEYVPKEYFKTEPTIKQKNLELFESLDEDEDIDNYYTNIKE